MTISDRTPTAVLLQEPADVYHAKSGEFLSSHLLADFRRCPQLYFRRRRGLLGDEDRPAYLLGRAAHTMILEGLDAFEAAFAVGGPINPKTGQSFGAGTKAFAEWAEQQGKPVLTDEQAGLVCRMNTAVQTHAAAIALLEDGLAEAVVRTDYCGRPSQIRMDWFDPHQGIVDLKTCDNLDYFEADSRRFGYAHQLAFYQAVLSRLIGLFMPVHLIAVEKKEPFRCGVWRVSQDSLSIARGDNEAAIERLKHCEASGDWPTGYEECRVLNAV